MKINKEAITLPLAVIGAVLGIVNLWWAISSSTIYLSIKPYPALKREENVLTLPRDLRELENGLNRFNEPKEIVITITNTGRATAWVTAVGFVDRSRKQKFYLVSPDLEAKGKFPLTPNEPTNINTKVTPELRQHLIAGVDAAFAETAGGKVFVGSTDVWGSYLQWLKKPNKCMEPPR